MELQARFASVGDCKTLSVGQLDINREYAILHASKTTTKYGDTVVLRLTVAPAEMVKVFLPHRYAVLFEDNIIRDINSRVISYALIYRGIIPGSKCYILSVKPL